MQRSCTAVGIGGAAPTATAYVARVDGHTPRLVRASLRADIAIPTAISIADAEPQALLRRTDACVITDRPEREQPIELLVETGEATSCLSVASRAACLIGLTERDALSNRALTEIAPAI